MRSVLALIKMPAIGKGRAGCRFLEDQGAEWAGLLVDLGVGFFAVTEHSGTRWW